MKHFVIIQMYTLPMEVNNDKCLFMCKWNKSWTQISVYMCRPNEYLIQATTHIQMYAQAPCHKPCPLVADLCYPPPHPTILARIGEWVSVCNGMCRVPERSFTNNYIRVALECQEIQDISNDK